MAACHADSASSALRVAKARVHALVTHTREVVWALGVQLAFTLVTSNQGVSDVSSRAGADWALGTSAVVAGCAFSVGSTGVWLTQVTGFERPAEGEGVSCHGLRAGAHWSQAAKVAVSVHAARVGARVDAGIVQAGGLVAGTLVV